MVDRFIKKDMTILNVQTPKAEFKYMSQRLQPVEQAFQLFAGG